MKILKHIYQLAALLICLFCPFGAFGAHSTKEQAWREFLKPDDSTRTKVWWFHGETETTREGITADLEAYKRAGIGGVVYYDQVHGDAKNALPALSSGWWEMLRFAASEAKRIGLSFEINVSNGFVAGGPWITKELGMQRLVASDRVVTGGKHFSGVLPAPGRADFWDVAVLAFPVSKDRWETSRDRKVQFSSSDSQLTPDAFFQPGNKLVSILKKKAGESVYINIEFESDFTARTITYSVYPRGTKASTGAMNYPGPPADSFYGMGYTRLPDFGQLEVSNDGIHYRKICDLKPIYKAPAVVWIQKTVSFPATAGRYFRLNLHDWWLPKDQTPHLALGNVTLSSRARIDQWEERAALFSEYIEGNATPDYASGEFINPDKIIDLTGKMDASGRLEWDVPEGEWVIMRFAHEPTGGSLKHGRPNLMGLECDKMSVRAVTAQWENYAKPIIDSLAAIGCLPEGVTMDSHEAGSQNWTPGFEEEFSRRKGYNMRRYLPAMMGYIVGSVPETDGFLYDMRRTMADMVSDNYYGTLQQLCSAAGVNFTAQATGNGLSLVADNLQAKGRVQKPQGEFWTSHPDGGYDVKEASSAAHMYGKRIASAEAFTGSRLNTSLSDAKNAGDYAYAFGVNEFVLCASAYQPWLDKYPGSLAGGKHYSFNRNNTLWEYSRPFWDWQARSASLMRKGMPVVDICVYLGQNAPVKLLTYRLPEIPEGYDFDVCTAEALTMRTRADDGRLMLPDGMSYRILAIQRNNDMPLHVLRHIAQLIAGGVTVYGPRPTGSDSLADADNKEEYNELVNRLWGADTTTSGIRQVGKGKLYWGMPFPEVLAREKIRPDITLKSGNTAKDKVHFAHRRLLDADVFYLNNHSNRIFNDKIRLRTKARYAEYWDAVTGTRTSLPVLASGTDNDGMLLELRLAPRESGFIVTSDQPNADLLPRLFGKRETAMPIAGGWDVYFDPKWGGPGVVVFNELTDWATNDDPRIRYYSGTAIYRKRLDLQKPPSNERVILRFSRMNFLGRIKLNGQEVSTVWCSPWEADLTAFIRDGENKLEIEVVNSLINRMIGDAVLPKEKRYTYSYPEVVKSTDKLITSGIMDKVLLVKYSLK